MCARIIVNLLYVILNVAVADATVITFTALCFKPKLTAGLAKQGAGRFTAFANVRVVEAIAAVLAEMELIVLVFHTNGRGLGAVGVALTAVKAKLAVVTKIHFAGGVTAIGAKVLIPIGVFNAVFTAAAALGGGIVLTAENAKSAFVTKLDSVLVKAFLTLLADNTALLAMQISKLTDIIRAVAVAAFLAMHQLKFPTAFAEAAAVAKAAHAVAAEPTQTAKFILTIYMAFVAAETMPALVNIAIFAGHTIKAENRFRKACSAFVAVCFDKALRICAIVTASTAHTAAILIPMVVVAIPTFHTVFPCCKCRCLQQTE